MKIDNQKDLAKLLKLLRKEGVEAIKMGDLELHLGRLPSKEAKKSKSVFIAPEENIKVPQFNGIPATAPVDDIDTDGLSEEQLLMYSVTGEAQ